MYFYNKIESAKMKNLILLLMAFLFTFSLFAQDSTKKDFEPKYRTILRIDKDIPIKEIQITVIYKSFDYNGSGIVYPKDKADAREKNKDTESSPKYE
jgi:hypothetical protein